MRHSKPVTRFWTRCNNLLSVICPLALVLTAACSGEGYACAQVITVAGPVVQITSVTNAQTGVAIGQFTLSNFFVNGQPQDAALLIAGVPNTNATVSGGTLVCSGACGFGQSADSYTFTISAAGVQSKTVTVAAKYAGSVTDGCSHELKDGTAIAITL